MAERLRVKFCGLARPEDVEEALRLGVDYLGFVFVAGSPCCLDVQRAAEWLAGFDTGPARRVGLFCDEPARRVNEIARRLRLDVIQLQGHEPRDYPRALNFPAIITRRAATCVRASVPFAPRYDMGLPPNVCALLVDAAAVNGVGGGSAGRYADVVPAARAPVAASLPFFLSGGLTPQNVADRVARHHPFGVDVCRGIEGAPGQKDVGRMRDFMQALGRLP